jgi:acid phosphatase type 7
MRAAIEPLLYKYQANIVIAGHVHAYERTHPVYRDSVDYKNGITYIVVGDAANYEVSVCGVMDGWVGGWMDGWMDGWGKGKGKEKGRKSRHSEPRRRASSIDDGRRRCPLCPATFNFLTYPYLYTRTSIPLHTANPPTPPDIHQGHAADYIEPQPAWSAYRNGTQYGHGQLIFHNDRKLTWQWHRNLDGMKILRDEVTVCNTAKGLPAGCGVKGGGKPDKMNPARASKGWSRQRKHE